MIPQMYSSHNYMFKALLAMNLFAAVETGQRAPSDNTNDKTKSYYVCHFIH